MKLYTRYLTIDIDRKGWYIAIKTHWGWFYILKLWSYRGKEVNVNVIHLRKIV